MQNISFIHTYELFYVHFDHFMRTITIYLVKSHKYNMKRIKYMQILLQPHRN